MHPLRTLLLVITLWLSATPVAFAQNGNGQPPPTHAERYAAIETAVAQAQADLEEAATPDAVSAARLSLQETRGRLQDLRRTFNTSKTQLENDIGLLGPPPAEGEPDSIADLRQSYGERLASFDRLLVLSNALEQQIVQLQESSAERLRNAFVTRIFERAPPPYMPAEITGALAEMWEKVAQTGQWIAGLSRNEGDAEAPRSLAIPIAAILASLALFYIINIPLRDRIADQLWRHLPKRQLTPAGAPAIAITRASTRIILGGIGVLLVHRVILETGIVPEGGQPTLTRMAQAVFCVLAANGISRAVFAPGRPEWRIPQISETTAATGHWGALAVATLFGLDQFVLALWDADSLGPFLRLETLVMALVFAGVLLVLHGRLATTGPAPIAQPDTPSPSVTPEVTAVSAPSRPPRRRIYSRLFLVLPAFVMVAASLLGYAAFSRWIFEKAAYFAMFLGFLYLLRAFLGAWTLLAVERLVFGQSRNEQPGDDVVGFWTRLSVDVLLAFAAAPIALAIIGLDWNEIRTLSLGVLSGFSVGAIRISPVNLVYGLLMVVVILVLTRLLQRVLENRILPMTRLNPGVRHSFKTLVGYVGLVIAFLTGVSAVGFDLSNLAIIAGALSVGIGFGLQSIVNNFVSGLILLFERPIKIGDWVITASGEGKVKRISVRSTEIETFDRCSIIVPNSELISSSVQNWTYKDQSARVVVAVGVSYDSDPDEIRRILLSCTEGVPDILRFPEPYVYFADYGDSALNFQLRFFIRDANAMLVARNDMRFRVFAALKDAGVEIPFPQRDVHIKTGSVEPV